VSESATRQTATASLKAPLASINRRRDETLAHFAPISVVKPGELMQTAPWTIANLQEILDKTGSILRKLDHFDGGIVGKVKYMGRGGRLPGRARTHRRHAKPPSFLALMLTYRIGYSKVDSREACPSIRN
jgi:hypothetical protein